MGIIPGPPGPAKPPAAPLSLSPVEPGRAEFYRHKLPMTPPTAAASSRPATGTVASTARAAGLTPRELAGRLAGLSLGQQVFVLAIWPFFEQLLNFLVTYVDLIMAGHLGSQAVPATNAIAVGGYVEWLIGLVQSAVGIGSTALIARAVGGRHKRLANSALGQSVILALAGGLVMGAFVFTAAPWIAGFTRLSGQSLTFCTQYLRIIAAAAPMSAVIFVGGSCLRGSGDTRTPFLVLVVVNLINSTLTYTFVRAPAPLGGHEVAGIAAGTFVAYVVGAILMATVLFQGWGGIRLYWHRLRPHWHTARRIIAVGLPSMAEMFFGMWIANFIVLRIVGSLHQSDAWGAHMIAIRAEAISYMPGFALGIAAATLCGQYLGLGDPRRARHAVILCWRAGMVVMGSMGLFFIIAPWVMVRIATNNAALLAASPMLLRTTGFVQIFFASAIVLGQAMRGAGDTRATMTMTALSTYGLRLPLAYLLGVYFGGGLEGVWLGLCGELTFRGLLFTGRFLHGGWMRARV